MASSYPGSLDSLTNPTSGDAMNSGAGHAAQHANANDAIEAIQTTLGVDPQGTFTDVAERLDSIPDPSAAADGDVLTVDTGAWVIAPGGGGGGGGGGLVLIDSASFSAAAESHVDAAIDSTYDEYRLMVKIASVGSGTPVLALRARASSADVTSGVYYGAGWAKSWGGGHVGWGPADGSTSMPLHYQGTSDVVAIFDLVKNGASLWMFSLRSVSNATGIACDCDGMIAAAMDGFKVFPASSTITGAWRLYGFEK